MPKLLNFGVIQKEKKLLLIVGAFYLSSFIFGYGAARFAAGYSGIHGRDDAVELIKQMQANPSVATETNQERLRISTGKTYDALFNSWDSRSSFQIILTNIGLATLLATFSVIPLTAVFALYKEVLSGFMLGFNGGLVAAADGSHVRFLAAIPHVFFEVPAILLTTALILRAGIIVIKKSYDQHLINRIFLAYKCWLEAAPLLVLLFLIAGLIEGTVTPYLVKNILAF